jgi:hypothetical protein
MSDVWVLQTNKAGNSYRDNLNKYRFLIIFDKLPIRWTCSMILPQLWHMKYNLKHVYSERSNRKHLEAHHHGKVMSVSLWGIWSVASETYMSMVALKRDLFRYFEVCYLINHVGYMNVICECLSLHYLFIWMDSVNF